MITEYALDTDAMSLLLASDRFDFARIQNRLDRENARLIIIDISIAECARGDPAEAFERLTNLRTLGDVLPVHRIGHAVRLRRIFEMEIRGEQFAGTPVLASGVHAPLHGKNRAKFIAEHDRFSQGIAAALTRTRMRLQDQRVEDETDPSTRRQYAESLPGFMSNLREVFGEDKWPLTTLVPDGPTHDPHLRRRMIVKDVAHARALAMFCGLAFLNATGAVTKHERRGAHARVVTSEDGNWDDANIAATAAYCRGIVTHDTRFTARLRALREAGLSSVEPVTLDDLGLGTGAGSTA